MRDFKWTEKQTTKLGWVLDVLDEFSNYKPLTLRQIYYQLVGKRYIENKVSQYVMLSNLLKWARIDGHIDWEDIEDRARAYHNLAGWSDKKHFAESEIDSFLKGYRRDLTQSQSVYLEVWIEKDALSSIFTRVAVNFAIPVTVCRGFSSVSFLNDFRDRVSSLAGGREPIMLYFGDFDPSGMEMLVAMETTLRYELGVDVTFKRIALLKEDIFTYNLPHDPSALKHSDTRARKHLAEHGELAVELDALSPDILEQKIRDAVRDELDLELFDEEVGRNYEDLQELEDMRNRVVEEMESWEREDGSE